MSEQRDMQGDKTIEMERGEDGVYRMVSTKHNFGYDSNSRLRTENLKGSLVNLTC